MKRQFTAIFLAFLVCYSHARILLEELMDLQKAEFGKNKVIINPRGPLNMIRGYVYSEMGYMHCKRFLSPEIETDYTLKWLKNLNHPEAGAYQHTRSARNDKAYGPSKNAAVESPEHSEYSENYHNTLIRMFPSVDGRNLSIHVAKEDSFIHTLQRICTKEQANYVLASLLLLSEGVIVPIDATHTKVTLWKTRNAESLYKREAKKDKKTSNSEHVFFDIDAKLHMSVPQKDFAKVVAFFKKYNKPEELPDTYEDFITGKFLNTPQFLIQAYVFEYIESQEDAVQFLECVHTLLESLGCVKELSAGKKDIYNQCFCATEEKEKAEEYLQPLSNIVSDLVGMRLVPFYTKSMLPCYKSVRLYDKCQGEFINGTFSNCVETGLYALFCSLAYDAKEKKYDVLRMLGDRKDRPETKELKDFFSLKDVAPNKCATIKVLEEWNRVMSGLKCDRIDYKSKYRNEMRSGIMNVLYVIAEVTGRLDTEQEKIDGLAQRLNREEDPEKNIYSEIEEYIFSLFKELSVNKEIELSVSDGCIGVQKNGKFDAFAPICLTYKNQETGLSLGLDMKISCRHLFLDLQERYNSVNGQSEMCNAASSNYRSDETFVGCILAEYFLYWTLKHVEFSDSSIEEMMPRITEYIVVDSSLDKKNVIFLLHHTLRMHHNKHIISSIFLHAKGKEILLNKTHPGVRLVLNIIAYISLEDDPRLIQACLQAPAQLGFIYALSPKVILMHRDIRRLFLGLNCIEHLHKYAPEGSDFAADGVMDYIRNYRSCADQPLSYCSALFKVGVAKAIFTGNVIQLADEINLRLFDVGCNELTNSAEVGYMLDLFWLIYALHAHSSEKMLIEKLYDRIAPIEITTELIRRILNACHSSMDLDIIKYLLKKYLQERQTWKSGQILKLLRTLETDAVV
ncbi:uncharacterized protein NEMAJ01_0726 [Nematocida major]|uniref:uncharacterized protein n=1 Tax=Nematocida major TaxID=1912982 RepID=UPI002007FF14|nr:uncharacterized protein NEMAJ01_0726 [Nematocida major]KAH9385830.1 hypothetical protein NEMAJ01_0726 [Nematocida major]